MDLKDKITFIAKSRFMDGKYHKYTNTVQLNGFIVSKPVEKDLMTGQHIMSFYVIQINNGTYTFYYCQAFSKNVQDTLRNIKNCSFINLLGRLVYSKKSRYSFQVEEVAVSHEYMDKDMELEPPYITRGE